MLLLPFAAAVGASLGWATGIILAQNPARMVGAFEFTRIQLIVCSALLAGICTAMGYWPSVSSRHFPHYILSVGFGVILGNLAMIACLRRGGPRRTEILLSLKAPLVSVMAYVWFGEVPSGMDLAGGGITLLGVLLAILSGDEAPAGQDRSGAGNLWSVILLGISASALQAFGFLVVKPAMLSGTEPLAVSALRLLGAACVISLIAVWPARIFRANCDVTPGILGRIILPGVLGYGVASSLLLYAFATTDAGIAAVLGFLSPVLILPLLWIRERRPPRFQAMAGAFLAVLGTGIIVLW